jgi:ADP-ribose pyrophosphatase
MSDTEKPVSVSDKKIEYRCPFMEIYSRHADFGDFAKSYYVVNFKRRSGVVALQDGNVLLVRQYRFLLNSDSWELPGGTIEDDENLEDGLRRECLEETGVKVQGLRPLLEYYPGLDNVDNRTTIFFTEEVETAREFFPDSAEVREIAWVPLDRCVEMVFKQGILDAMTVTGILGYAYARRRGGAPISDRSA